MSIRRGLGLLIITALLAVAGCDGTPARGSDATPWPTSGWERVAEDDGAAFSEALAPMYSYIENESLPFESVIVIRQGLLAEETYLNGAADGPTALFSATKSVNSLLMGIAIDESLVPGEDETVLSFFPDKDVAEPSALKDAVTIEDLLTMSTGFEWQEGAAQYADPDSPYNEWVATEDRVQYALDLPMATESGTTYSYCTPASQLIPAIIQETAGTTTLEFADEHLFGPLGISTEDVIWKADPSGVQKVGGLNMRPLDMAKIGYLVLHDGEWDGTQVVSAEWIQKSMEPAFGIENGVSFGYHWYIHDADGMTFYSAQGFGDQAIYVLPDLDAVVVFTGYNVESAPKSLYLLRAFVIPALQG